MSVFTANTCGRARMNMRSRRQSGTEWNGPDFFKRASRAVCSAPTAFLCSSPAFPYWGANAGRFRRSAQHERSDSRPIKGTPFIFSMVNRTNAPRRSTSAARRFHRNMLTFALFVITSCELESGSKCAAVAHPPVRAHVQTLEKLSTCAQKAQTDSRCTTVRAHRWRVPSAESRRAVVQSTRPIAFAACAPAARPALEIRLSIRLARVSPIYERHARKPFRSGWNGRANIPRLFIFVGASRRRTALQVLARLLRRRRLHAICLAADELSELLATVTVVAAAAVAVR